MNPSDSVYIIAEAGVNHNGSLSMAKELIDAAAEAGADAVKFQSFKTEQMIRKTAPKAAYQQKTGDREQTQFELLKQLEIDEDFHRVLSRYAKEKGIDFLSTPFDLESLQFLAETLDLPRMKISSGDIDHGPLLLKAAQTGKPVILSTGMSTLSEVELALSILAYGYTHGGAPSSWASLQAAYVSKAGQDALREKVSLLHCTTEYPAPFHEVNLRAMDTLKAAFGLPVGFSDHTEGVAISIAAVARGARIIEKHFTLDRNLPGPDHQVSLEPAELKEMVQAIRQVELALGSPRKLAAPSELKNKALVRKSLAASREIRRGERFTEENLCIKRPADGLLPCLYWDLLGKAAQRDYKEEEPIQW